MTSSLKANSLCALAAATLVACVSSRTTVYPANWPTTRKNTTCAELSGVFVNKAVSTTIRQIPGASPRTDYFLSELLQFGMRVSASPPAVVELLPEGGRVRIAAVESGRPAQSLSTIGQWLCEAGQPPKLIMQRDAVGESVASGKRDITYAFYRGVDDTLIVHSAVRSRGIGFALLPYSDSFEEWFRFEVQR